VAIDLIPKLLSGGISMNAQFQQVARRRTLVRGAIDRL